jgi:hypothetical protein
VNIASTATVKAFSDLLAAIHADNSGNQGDGYYVNALFDTAPSASETTLLKIYAGGGSEQTSALLFPAGYTAFAYTTGAALPQDDKITAWDAAGTVSLGLVVRQEDGLPQIGSVTTQAVLPVELADALLSVSVPIKMIFAAFASGHGQLSSPQYTITNLSRHPLTVSLDSFTLKEADGLTLSQNPVSAGEIGLRLAGQRDTPGFGTGFLSLGSGLNLALAGEGAPLAPVNQPGSVGYFRIEGLYKGLFDAQRLPSFAASFKLRLLLP